MANSMSARVCVGAITGAFGVRGEVRLKSFCADPGAIADYAPLTTEDGARDFDLAITRPVKGGFAARLGGVATKEAAEALKGVRLFAPRDRLPSLADDEYYHADLIGLRVLDTGGVTLGRVKAVLNHGASDLLEISLIVGGQMLLPFTREAVPTVDIAAGCLIADPPEAV